MLKDICLDYHTGIHRFIVNPFAVSFKSEPNAEQASPWVWLNIIPATTFYFTGHKSNVCVVNWVSYTLYLMRKAVLYFKVKQTFIFDVRLLSIGCRGGAAIVRGGVMTPHFQIWPPPSSEGETLWLATLEIYLVNYSYMGLAISFFWYYSVLRW